MEETFYSKQSKEAGKQLLLNISKKIEDSNLLEEEKKKLFEFIQFKQSEGVKDITISKVVNQLLVLRKGSRKFHQNSVIKKAYTNLDLSSKQEFIPIIAEIEKRKWSNRHKESYKRSLNAFTKFLADTGKERVQGLKFMTIKKERPQIDPTLLLSFEDIQSIVLHEKNIMGKALIWFAFETGARSSELISIRLRDVSFDKNSDLVHVRIPQTKTIPREFDIRDSKMSLMHWISVHPLKNDENAPLFVKKAYDEQGNKLFVPLELNNVHDMLVLSCKRAGVSGKKCTPKWFRKASLCDWVGRRGVDNAYILMRIAGHVEIGTAQAYIEFTNKQLTDYLKEKYGLKAVEHKQVDYNHCKVCGSLISPEDRVCLNCNYSPKTDFNEVMNGYVERVARLEKAFMEFITVVNRGDMNTSKLRNNIGNGPGVENKKTYIDKTLSLEGEIKQDSLNFGRKRASKNKENSR